MTGEKRDPRARSGRGEANGVGRGQSPEREGPIVLRRSEGLDPRWVLVAVAVGLVVFWTVVALLVIELIDDVDEATSDLSSSSSSSSANGWPLVERCSVVMPEDLDR